jgi:hypothetical protein
LKRKVAEAEAAIAALEEEQAKILESLGEGSLDAQGMAEAGKRLKALEFDLGKRTMEWEEAALALEELSAE